MAVSKFVLDSFRLMFGKNMFVDWTRSSSKYTHTLKFYVRHMNGTDYIHIGTRTGLASSHTLVMTEGERDLIARHRMGGNGAMRYTLETFNGSKSLGTSTLNGVIEMPNRSTINAGKSDAGVYEVGKTYTIKQESENPETLKFFNMNVRVMYKGNEIDYIPRFKGSTTWTPKSSIASKITSGNGIDVIFEMRSYYDNFGDEDTPLRYDAFTKPATIKAPSTPPVWDKILAAQQIKFTEQDINVANAMSGSIDTFVGSQSKITLTIPKTVVSTPNAQHGATISRYRVAIGSEIVGEFPATGTSFNLGTCPNLHGKQRVRIYAIDTWGNSSYFDKTIKIFSYTPPEIWDISARRNNGYEGNINLGLTGIFSSMVINGEERNQLSATVFMRVKGASTWNEVAKNFTFTASGGEDVGGIFQHLFETNRIIVNTVENDTMEFRASISDRYTSDVMSYIKIVPPGRPKIFFDKTSGSIGMNCFPKSNYGLDVDLDVFLKRGLYINALHTGSNMYSTGTPAIHLHNSDIVGMNRLFFNDSSESDAEGIQFPKTGFVDTPNQSDCDTVRALDGQLFFNSRPVPVADSGVATASGVQEKNSSNYKIEIDVKFNKTFEKPPTVIVNPRTTVPGKLVLGQAATTVTTTGFTLHAYRTNGTATGFDWIALSE